MLFAAGAIEACQRLIAYTISKLWHLLDYALFQGQILRLLPTSVHIHDLEGPATRYRHAVKRTILRGTVRDRLRQDICLEVEVVAIPGLQNDILRRQLLGTLHIAVHLKVHAALQFRTLSCEFLRIEGEILESRCCRADGLELGQPLRAT